MASAQLGDAKEWAALTSSRLSPAAISCDALATPDSVISTSADSTCRAPARYFVAHDTWIVPTQVTKTMNCRGWA
jgi:hypothetical protein